MTDKLTCTTCGAGKKPVAQSVESGSRDHTEWSLLLDCGHIINHFTYDIGPGYRALERLPQISSYTAMHSARPIPTGHEELHEEVQLAIDGLKALTGEQKDKMESITGYSANAIAHLFTTLLTKLAEVERERDALQNLLVEAGGASDDQ